MWRGLSWWPGSAFRQIRHAGHRAVVFPQDAELALSDLPCLGSVAALGSGMFELLRVGRPSRLPLSIGCVQPSTCDRPEFLRKGGQ